MLQVAIPIFKGFTALDVVGPYEVLHLLPNVNVVFVSHTPGAYVADLGMLSLNATASFEDVPKPHVVVVPGGPGTQLLLQDQVFMAWIRKVHETTIYTTSVCTGSLLLAASGILNGLEATTHWNCYNLLASYGVKPVHLRVVLQGKIITSGGVSSGLDMALRLAALISDQNTAKALQLFIEYDPQPPYDTGTAIKAGPQITELSKELAAKAATRMSAQAGNSSEVLPCSQELVATTSFTCETTPRQKQPTQSPWMVEAGTDGPLKKMQDLRPRVPEGDNFSPTGVPGLQPSAKKRKVDKTRAEDDEEKGKSRTSSRWPEQWVIALIHIRGAMQDEFAKPPKQGVNLWQKVFLKMVSAFPAFDKDEEACRKKWKAVYTDYKEDKEMMATGNRLEKSKWYNLIDEYMMNKAQACLSLRCTATRDSSIELDKDEKADEKEDRKDGQPRPHTTKLQKVQLEHVHNFMERMATTNEVFVEQLKATTNILSDMQGTLAMLANKLGIYSVSAISYLSHFDEAKLAVIITV